MRCGLFTCRRLVLAALALLVVVATVPASATNGYLIHGVGTRAKALAGAGVAMPQDALAPGTNPAGLAYVDGRFDLGVAWFMPDRSYTISGNPSGFPGTFGLIPGTVESDSTDFFVPNFGANWELAPNARFGLAVYGQGGMNTDWPTSTFFGSSPTGVNLSQLFVLPTYAVKTGSGNHAFGISPILAYQVFEIEGIQAFGGFSSDPARLTNNGEDESTGFGVKVGYLGQFTPQFSVGFSYQSEVSMEEFSDYAGLFAEQGGFDIPSNYVVGFAYKFGASAALMVDYQEIFYSDVPSVHSPLFPNLGQALQGDPNSLLGGSNGPGFGWQDMEVIKVGLQWGGGPWVWRAGFSITDQPIPETEVLFNILAPGVMEEHYTFGFSRDFGRGKAFSLSIMHAPSVEVSGPNPLEVPGLQTISFEMDQWDVEFGFSWGL